MDRLIYMVRGFVLGCRQKWRRKFVSCYYKVHLHQNFHFLFTLLCLHNLHYSSFLFAGNWDASCHDTHYSSGNIGLRFLVFIFSIKFPKCYSSSFVFFSQFFEALKQLLSSRILMVPHFISILSYILQQQTAKFQSQ